MTIETKYNIGDEVWRIWENKPTMFKIKKIIIVKDDIKTQIQYVSTGNIHLFQDEIFPTKEELLKSL